jgi:integrase/recombinase XerD
MGAREGKAKALSLQEHHHFIEYLSKTRHSERDLAIYLVTCKAGLRIGTVAGLLLSDVLDESGKVKEVVILRKCITKGSKTITAFFSHPELREALSAYLKVRRGRSPYLFVNQKNQAFTPNSLSITMLRHYQKAGLEGASSHSGRRQYASALLKSGVDIVALSKLMGHSSITTTQKYVHHDDSELLKYVANAS